VLPICAAVPALLLAKVWLRFSPRSALKWAANRNGSALVQATTKSTYVDNLARAIGGVGARQPVRATCLEQALALVGLLSLTGVPARLVIGVSRPDPTLRAHAWVECDGRIVLGSAQSHGLTPLPAAPPLCRE
jgi:Transglutaminase-like superfamily